MRPSAAGRGAYKREGVAGERFSRSCTHTHALTDTHTHTHTPSSQQPPSSHGVCTRMPSLLHWNLPKAPWGCSAAAGTASRSGSNWTIHWFCGSMQALLCTTVHFHRLKERERERFKVRVRGTSLKSTAGATWVPVSKVAHGASLSSSVKQMQPHSEQRLRGPGEASQAVTILEAAEQRGSRVGGCWGQVGAATRYLARFLNLPGCPLPCL